MARSACNLPRKAQPPASRYRSPLSPGSGQSRKTAPTPKRAVVTGTLHRQADPSHLGPTCPVHSAEPEGSALVRRTVLTSRLFARHQSGRASHGFPKRPSSCSAPESSSTCAGNDQKPPRTIEVSPGRTRTALRRVPSSDTGLSRFRRFLVEASSACPMKVSPFSSRAKRFRCGVDLWITWIAGMKLRRRSRPCAGRRCVHRRSPARRPGWHRYAGQA